MSEDSKETICYTIGHSDLPIDAFIYFVKKFKIKCIIDVRSTPYSLYQPQFSQENIILSLKKEDIDYRYLGKEIGGKYRDPDLLFSDGTVNYQKVSEMPKFQKGIDEIVTLVKSGKTISLMCSEKDPLKCHRFVLISRNLITKGVNVLHLCPEIVVKTNKELEQQMSSEIIDIHQTKITHSSSNDIDTIYEQQNKKIGSKVVNEPTKDRTHSSNITDFCSNSLDTLQTEYQKNPTQNIIYFKDLINLGLPKNSEQNENQLDNNEKLKKKFEQKTLF